MTSILQPAEVCWFRTIKSEYNHKWAEWFLISEPSFTAAGNPRGPSSEKVLEWIGKIWEEFDPELIVLSFESCGITSSRELRDVLNHMVYEKIIMSEVIEEQDVAEQMPLCGLIRVTRKKQILYREAYLLS